MGYHQLRNLQNQIRQLKMKSAELRALSSNIKEKKGKIDFSNRQETLTCLYEIRGEINTQIRIIDSTMKNGVRNLAPTFAGASVSDHGAWGSLKGKYKDLKTELTAIHKHVDFMSTIFENKKATTTHNMGELISEVQDISQQFKDGKKTNPISESLDVLAVVLVLLAILNRYKKS